jgi:hypothetical protein
MYEGRLCRPELNYDVYAVRKVIAAVFGFPVFRIAMFLGLLDLHPDL